MAVTIEIGACDVIRFCGVRGLNSWIPGFDCCGCTQDPEKQVSTFNYLGPTTQLPGSDYN